MYGTNPGNRTAGATARAAMIIGCPVRLIEDRTPAASTVFSVQPLPEAYTSRRILVEYQSAENQVSWNLGILKPGEEKILQVETKCQKLARKALNVAVATADPGLQVQAEAAIEIIGVVVSAAMSIIASELGTTVEPISAST